MSSRHVKPPGVSANIFMNYRREDSAGHAGRLFDALSDHFAGQLFMDVDTLEPGTDFVDAIEQAVGSCDALIVVIGRQWLTIADKAGRRRLEDPGDFVRLEIESALARKIRVIPVLVQDAPMPRADELPPSLARLARRHGIELSDDRWKYDVDRLAQTIRDLLADLTPRPSPAPAPVAPPARSRAWPASLAALVLVAAVVLVSLAWTRRPAVGNDDGLRVQPPAGAPAATAPAAGGGIASPAIVEPAVRPAGQVPLAGAGVTPVATAPPEPPPVIETAPRVVETPVVKHTDVEVPKPVTRAATPVPTPVPARVAMPVATPVPTPIPARVPTPVPEPTETTIVFGDDDEASTQAAATEEQGTSDPVPSPPPASRPARASILTPRNGEVVGSEVMVEGLVFGLGEQQIFLGIRQKNGAIYPRGELFPNADGQWSIKLRSSKEKTFGIVVVTSTSQDATRVLRDQKSRDDGLAALPEGASISSGVVTLQRPGKLIRVLRPLVPGSSD